MMARLPAFCDFSRKGQRNDDGDDDDQLDQGEGLAGWESVI